MKRNKKIGSILILVLAFSLSGISQGKKIQVYEIPGLNDSIVKQKNVAILPFRVSIFYTTLPKDYNYEDNLSDEQKRSKRMQESMFAYINRQAKFYTVKFQDIEKTNELLSNYGILNRIDELAPDSICRLLNVDALIKCYYTYENFNTEDHAVMTAIMSAGKFSIPEKTGIGQLTMFIYHATNAELLWKYYGENKETLFTDSSELVRIIMKKVSKYFPYQK